MCHAVSEKKQQTIQINSAIFNEKIEIRERDSIPKRCKGVHCVDHGESFPTLIPTRIYLQNLASIQPRTSLVKFARSLRTDPPGLIRGGYFMIIGSEEAICKFSRRAIWAVWTPILWFNFFPCARRGRGEKE